MKISELISQLQKIQLEHGELYVLIGAKKGIRCQTFSDVCAEVSTMMRNDFLCISSEGLDDALYEDAVY